MSKTKKILPELRFPEFKDCGEWEEEKLGEVATKNIDKTKGKRCKLMSITAGQGLISQIEKFGREIAGNSYNNYIVIKKDDFVYNKSSTKIYREGEIARYNDNEEGAVPNSIFISFKFDTAKVYPLFAGFLFEKNIHGYWLRKFISMGARAHGALQVNDEDFFAMPLSFPSIPEQQRIAACLSSLDELISAHSQKLELLKTHKKGLMQNMFPQEGEKVPKLRFKEFENDGEWVEKRLGQIGDFIGGGTPDTSIQEYWDGEILWYTPTEVKNDNLRSSIRKITEQGLKNSSAKLLPKGTILITSRATIGGVAITEKECTTNQGFQSLTVNNSEVNTFWFYWILQNKKELIKRASGSTFQEIRKNEITNIPTLSPQKAEQQKIASCLSSLDELITAQSKKIEQLKQHKKGLMQGLFPKINE